MFCDGFLRVAKVMGPLIRSRRSHQADGCDDASGCGVWVARAAIEVADGILNWTVYNWMCAWLPQRTDTFFEGLLW